MKNHIVPSFICLLFLFGNACPAQEPAELRHVPVFQEKTDGYNSFRIPSLIQAADGSLLLFAEARKYDNHDPGWDGQEIDLVLKRSEDGGETWSPMQMIHKAPEKHSAGNPAALLDRDTGRLWLLYLLMKPGRNTFKARPKTDDQQTFVIYSDDHGKTWSEPRDITAENRDMNDDTWGVSVIGPGGAVQDFQGRLVFPAWRYTWGNFVVYSDDHGKTWKRTGPIAPKIAADEPQMVVLADGSWLIDMRQNHFGKDPMPTHRWLSRSSDGGRTWSEPVAGQTVTPVCCSIERFTLKSEGADADRILWTGPKGPGRRDLVVQISSDDAKTFPVEKLVKSGNIHYSDMQQLKDGNVGLVWEDRAVSIYWTLLPKTWLLQ